MSSKGSKSKSKSSKPKKSSKSPGPKPNKSSKGSSKGSRVSKGKSPKMKTVKTAAKTKMKGGREMLSKVKGKEMLSKVKGKMKESDVLSKMKEKGKMAVRKGKKIGKRLGGDGSDAVAGDDEEVSKKYRAAQGVHKVELTVTPGFRKLLSTLSLYAAFIAFLMGLGDLICSICAHFIFMAHLSVAQKKRDIRKVPAFLLISGLVETCLGFIGSRVMSKYKDFMDSGEDESTRTVLYHNRKLKFAVNIYIAFGLFSLVMMITFSVETFAVRSAIADGIVDTMKYYGTDLLYKKSMDDLQRYYECCGLDTYSDWFDVSWIDHEKRLPGLLKRINYEKYVINGVYKGKDVPFTCCDKGANRPCEFYNADNSLKIWKNYDPDNLTIYTEGCRKKVEDNVNPLLITSILWRLTLFFCCASFVITSRLVQTSFESEHLRKEQPPVGYLF